MLQQLILAVCDQHKYDTLHFGVNGEIRTPGEMLTETTQKCLSNIKPCQRVTRGLLHIVLWLVLKLTEISTSCDVKHSYWWGDSTLLSGTVCQ